MNAVVECAGLTKRYGRHLALRDCTLSVPAGKVVGLVGPNGAGKTTLLQLACGLLEPTAGTIAVFGGRPAADPTALARVGFVAQDAPTYARLSVADHLRLGARLNPTWDAVLARRRIAQFNLDPRRPAGKLSGGQRAQLALTLALAKRPDLLILDEPVASLDPLARRQFLQSLMEFIAEHGTSVILSSHLIADLSWVCDHLVVLTAAEVRLTGEVEELLATHHRLYGAYRHPTTLAPGHEVVDASHTSRQSTLIVRSSAPIDDPRWKVEQLGLEDLVLAYLAQTGPTGRTPTLETQR